MAGRRPDGLGIDGRHLLAAALEAEQRDDADEGHDPVHDVEHGVGVAWAKLTETKCGMDATDPLPCLDCVMRLASAAAWGSPVDRSVVVRCERN